jgi:hypothetical protein
MLQVLTNNSMYLQSLVHSVASLVQAELNKTL